jgi:hypothetical protein
METIALLENYDLKAKKAIARRLAGIEPPGWPRRPYSPTRRL